MNSGKKELYLYLHLKSEDMEAVVTSNDHVLSCGFYQMKIETRIHQHQQL